MANTTIAVERRICVLGVGISVVNMDSAVETILGWVHKGEKHYVCVRDVHGVMKCQSDKVLNNIHQGSGLTLPDGMPLVWLGKMYGFSTMSRVYGPDLMMAICKRSVPKGYTHFLCGGNIGVAEKLRKRLEDRFPGIQIVGTYMPPFRPLNPNEEQELEEQVRAVKPDLFWVGLSTPKQEYFMGVYLPRLEVKVMIGVGAAFDIHTGRARDAPRWVKAIGMQWLHRLCQEPRRLWKRYLYNNPIFIYKITKQLLRDGFRPRKED